jgi:hypothetical protein
MRTIILSLLTLLFTLSHPMIDHAQPRAQSLSDGAIATNVSLTIHVENSETCENCLAEADAVTNGFQCVIGGERIAGPIAQDTLTYARGVMSLHVSLKGDHAIDLDILNFAGEGTYQVSDGITAAAKVSTGNKTYSTSAKTTGIVTITSFDSQSRKVSGTFQFSAEEPNGKMIEVSAGSFATVE